jgi:hypothetical protein
MVLPLGHYYIQINILSFILIVFTVLLWFLIFIYPMTKILRRTGYSGWWVLLLFVPLGNVVGLWCLAFARWPALETGVRRGL